MNNSDNLSVLINRCSDEISQRLPDDCDFKLLVELGQGFYDSFKWDSEPFKIDFSEIYDVIPAEKVILKAGTVSGVPLLVLEGHFYPADGYGVNSCILPVCAAVNLGVEKVVVVEAGLSLRGDYTPGTWVAPTDFINMNGMEPWIGKSVVWKNPHADVRELFCQELLSDTINAVNEELGRVRLGVLQSNPGPRLPSPIEASVSAGWGVDFICFGILPEAMAVFGMGAKVTALVLLPENATRYEGSPASMEFICREAELSSEMIARALEIYIKSNNIQ